MFANIFKNKGQFELVLTDSHDISKCEWTIFKFGTKKEAKDFAKKCGAKAWNY